MIRILLVDDHTLFRSGISALLASQDDIDVVGEAGEGSEALKLVQTLQPDIMLLDLNMPGLSGLEVLKLTLEDNPQQAVIMLRYPKNLVIYYAPYNWVQKVIYLKIAMWII
jgi:two-component system nitrate/nitrite response regulator NarL